MRKLTTPHPVVMVLHLVASTVLLPSKVMVSSLLQASMVHHLRVNTVLLHRDNTANLLKAKVSTARHLQADSMVSLLRDRASMVLRRLVNMVSSDLLRVVLRLREDILVSSSMASHLQAVGTRSFSVRRT
jgi:hypothetical protein